MLSFARRLGLVALLSTSTVAPAFAQGVMAQEVWASWQEGLAQKGVGLHATETREGNQLVLQNVSLDLGGEAGILYLQNLRLTSQADGSVSVHLPDSFPVMIDLPKRSAAEAAGGGFWPERVIVTVRAEGLKLSVQGLGARGEFVATAQALSLSLDKVIPAQPEGMNLPHMQLRLEGADIRYMQDLAHSLPMLDAGMAFEALSARFSQDSTLGTPAEIDFALGPSELSINGAMPVQSAANSVVARLSEGLRAGVELTLGPAQLTGGLGATADLGATPPPQTFHYSFASARLNAGLDQAKLRFDFGVSQSTMALKGPVPELPNGTFEMSVDEGALLADMALGDLSQRQNWSMSATLSNLSWPENLWNTIEPSGKLTRDPMGFGVDLSGRYRLAPEVVAGEWPENGHYLREFGLNLRNFYSSALGVSVEGTGGLQFDLNAPAEIAGTPLPEGRFDFTTSGVNALLETLAQTPYVSAQDLSAWRILLMMVGRGREGADTFDTTLEFKDGGLVLNGVAL